MSNRNYQNQQNQQNNQRKYDRNPNRQQTYQHPNTYNARVNKPSQPQHKAPWASQFSNDQYKQYQSYQKTNPQEIRKDTINSRMSGHHTTHPQMKQPSHSNAEPTASPSTNEANNKNELEKNMSVAVQNSQLSKTNDSVASFYSLSMDQINSLKQQTRKFGVLGLVFFDEKTDTLRIESTKS